VHDFYNHRRRGHANVQPNAAHFALAKLEREHGGTVTVITQNVDALHEAAGSKNLIHMHGELLKVLCALCGERHAWSDDLSLKTPCPACSKKGGMRPDVVWFGEMPYEMERIFAALARADLFVSIGTSGAVYPAAGFVQQAKSARARTLELNLERSQGSAWFDESRLGPASELVPAWVEEMLR